MNARPALAAAVAALLAWPPAAAQDIYRQRLPDGSIVFTDRPQPDAVTEKRWSWTPEDPQAAAARREELRREIDAINARIERGLDRGRERELQAELARARAAQAQAEAERAAARARAEAYEPPRYVIARPLRPPRPPLPPVLDSPAPRRPGLNDPAPGFRLPRPDERLDPTYGPGSRTGRDDGRG